MENVAVPTPYTNFVNNPTQPDRNNNRLHVFPVCKEIRYCSIYHIYEAYKKAANLFRRKPRAIGTSPANN